MLVGHGKPATSFPKSEHTSQFDDDMHPRRVWIPMALKPDACNFRSNLFPRQHDAEAVLLADAQHAYSEA